MYEKVMSSENEYVLNSESQEEKKLSAQYI